MKCIFPIHIIPPPWRSVVRNDAITSGLSCILRNTTSVRAGYGRRGTLILPLPLLHLKPLQLCLVSLFLFREEHFAAVEVGQAPKQTELDSPPRFLLFRCSFSLYSWERCMIVAALFNFCIGLHQLGCIQIHTTPTAGLLPLLRRKLFGSKLWWYT